MVERITDYFPLLSERQKDQLNSLLDLYKDWNSKINVISRKDIDELFLRHVLHSLGIAKVISFQPKSKILDVGTGGGFPGIPLAILFPECQFYLVDSIAKKLKVVDTIVSSINLKNVSHNIKDIWWNGHHIMGKIEILPTPSGNILQALINSGITVGVSSRGMGSVRQMGETLEVQDDFELLCWDFVSTPSNPGSWMTPLHEGLTKAVNKHDKANEIIREILCAHGSCPIF